MFMYSLYGDACQWYFSLPPSIISSLKDFHRAFTEHCKRYFSYEFAFCNCCEEYKLHSKVEYLNREESYPHNLHHISKDVHCDVPPHKYELERSNEEAEGFSITSISDFYEFEEISSLAKHGDDQLSVGQMFVETSKASPQFLDSHVKGSYSSQEEQDFQGLSNI